MPIHSRRELLSLAATGAGARVLGAAAGSPQIGILIATTYNTGTLEQRLDEVKAAGIKCVQMSMACAGLAEMPDQIPPELPARIRREARTRGIAIGAVTGTFNMAHPDPDHRQAGLQRLRLLAEACPEIGTSSIHICTGTRNRESMWRIHPDNNSPQAWKDMSATVREAAAIARQAKVVLAFEPEMSNVVDSAVKARRLLDEIGSPHLKVTIDPANLFHKGELPRMKEILDEAFELLGRDIALAHAKDLDHDGDAGHKPAGHGVLDYGRYMSLLKKVGFTGPLFLHGLTREQVSGCLAFLKSKLAGAAA